MSILRALAALNPHPVEHLHFSRFRASFMEHLNNSVASAERGFLGFGEALAKEHARSGL
jgi:hypothetical protein